MLHLMDFRQLITWYFTFEVIQLHHNKRLTDCAVFWYPRYSAVEIICDYIIVLCLISLSSGTLNSNLKSQYSVVLVVGLVGDRPFLPLPQGDPAHDLDMIFYQHQLLYT